MLMRTCNRWLAALGTLVFSAACSGGAQPTLASSPTPLPPGVTQLDPGRHSALVFGSGSYPTYSVVVPAGWYLGGQRFTLKYPTTDKPRPVLGISVWDVGQVPRDSCQWQGSLVDPGRTVDDLVAALAAQTPRNATTPKNVALAGYSGRYLELSVPADIKSSTWTDFDICDVDSSGHRDFLSWLGNGMGDRYEEVPGQVDHVWILDVNGQRLVVDATYSPDTSQSDRDEQNRVVESLRFVPS